MKKAGKSVFENLRIKINLKDNGLNYNHVDVSNVCERGGILNDSTGKMGRERGCFWSQFSELTR